MSVVYNDIIKAIRKKKLSGEILCIHSSLKSFGSVDGGAETVIKAFLDENCTIVVPTFSYDFEVQPPKDLKLLQNGYDYSINIVHSEKIFTEQCNDIAKSMGLIPKTVLATKGRFRGIHPLNSFTAIGPKAEEIILGQTFQDVYEPLRKIYELGGKLILIGVDLTKATPIHFSEQLAGKNLFVRWVKNSKNEIVNVRVGSCSEGFNQLTPFVENIEDNIVVGNSKWRIYNFKEFIDSTTDAIRNNSEITHCDNKDCLRCNDMAKGGVILAP